MTVPSSLPTTPSYPRRGVGSVKWDRDPNILARMKEVWRLSVEEALSNHAIAQRLNIDVKTVRVDLKRLETLWQREVGLDTARLRTRKLIELQDLARRGLQAYEEDRKHVLAVLYDEPFSSYDCPGGVSHGLDATGQPMPVCSEKHTIELRAYRDAKGSAAYKGQGVAALQLVRQTFMDIAKLQGLVIDKMAATDNAGNDLGQVITQLFNDMPGQGQLPAGRVVDAEVRSMVWSCPECQSIAQYHGGDVKKWPDGRPCSEDGCDGVMDLDEQEAEP